VHFIDTLLQMPNVLYNPESVAYYSFGVHKGKDGSVLDTNIGAIADH